MKVVIRGVPRSLGRWTYVVWLEPRGAEYRDKVGRRLPPLEGVMVRVDSVNWADALAAGLAAARVAGLELRLGRDGIVEERIRR